MCQPTLSIPTLPCSTGTQECSQGGATPLSHLTIFYSHCWEGRGISSNKSNLATLRKKSRFLSLKWFLNYESKLFSTLAHKDRLVWQRRKKHSSDSCPNPWATLWILSVPKNYCVLQTVEITRRCLLAQLQLLQVSLSQQKHPGIFRAVRARSGSLFSSLILEQDTLEDATQKKTKARTPHKWDVISLKKTIKYHIKSLQFSRGVEILQS